MTTSQPAALPELPEGVTLEDLLIPLRSALNTCHDSDWTLRQFKTHITHALAALAALQSQPAASAIAEAIHYPDCWDQMAYPTLESALHELTAWFKCSNEECKQPAAAGVSDAGETAKTSLAVLCAIRDLHAWHPNMLKDIDFAIESNRHILALRPQAVPMTEHERGNQVMEHLGPAALTGGRMSVLDAFNLGIDAAEAHHGITAQGAQGEQG